jgi:glutathione S-transferase
VLVHDGQVHIESNDILDYLEQLYPEPPLMPAQQSAELTALLKVEDDLHVDLRNLTMRFTAPAKLMQRSEEQLQQYKSSGTGTVGGAPDSHKAEELEYWRNFAANQGIADSQVIESVSKFKQELDKLERRLGLSPSIEFCSRATRYKDFTPACGPGASDCCKFRRLPMRQKPLFCRR